MVAYGETLRRSCRPGWEHAYVDYESLKDILELIEALEEEQEEQNADEEEDAAVDKEEEEEEDKEERAQRLEAEFLTLLRREIEKVSLFCLSRQGEIAEAVGALKFDDHPEWSIVPRTALSLQASSSASPTAAAAAATTPSEEEGEEFGEEAALLPSGSIVRGPLKTPKASNRKGAIASEQPRKDTPARPLFKARSSLQDSYTDSTHKADRYTEQGVELLHILRFICVNAMAIRKIIKKHDKTMIQWRNYLYYHHHQNTHTNNTNTNAATTKKRSDRRGHHRRATSLFTGHQSVFMVLVDGPEDHLQQLANSASVAAIQSSLLTALQDPAILPISVHYAPQIRLQCTVSSIQILREYAARMEETFQGFLSQKAMINTGHNSGGVSAGTQQALQLVIRFQPDSLLLMNNNELYEWQHRVFGTNMTYIMEQNLQSGSVNFKEHLDLEQSRKHWGGVNASSMIINLMSALLYTVNYYIVAPTANHYAVLLGVDGAFGATLVGASSMSAIFAAFMYSYWYTKGSFRSALVCSALCPVLGNLLYAVAISFQSMTCALVGRLLVGLGSAEVVNRQLISACVSFRYMTAASAYFVAASAIGMSLGPLLAAILDMNAGRDKGVDIKLPWMMPSGGIIFNHVTSPGFVMAFLWFLELLALLILFREPQRVNATTSETTPVSDADDVGNNDDPTSPNGKVGTRITEYGTVASASPASSPKYNQKLVNRASGVLGELILVKQLVFDNVALPITMLIFGFIELVDEVLISSCSMVVRRYFGWHGGSAGILLASLGALVLPAHYFVESASHRYEERAIMKYAIISIFFGLFAILNYEGLVFDLIGFAIKAVEPGDFSPADATASNSTSAGSQLDISVGGQSITGFLNKYLEVPYDWGAGLVVYITFLSAIFMGTIILEGVDTSLMAQKTPPGLNDTFINSGLLATLVGTLGRVVGDSIITFSALVDSDIFTDFVNATFFPIIPLSLIGFILVRRNYSLFVSE